MRDRQQVGGAVTGAGVGRGRPGRLAAAALVVASAWALLAAGAAQASTVTVGSVLPVTFTSKPFEQVKTLFNTALPEKGANLVSPASGAIVRWRLQGAKGGPFYLRVLHPNGSGAYLASGTSGPATPSGTGLQTFTANIPVKAGDLIGIDPTSGSDEIGVASAPGANYAFIFPPPFDGATVAPSGTVSGEEIELSAEVQPTPSISEVSPGSGSVAGGATVTITGANFSAASAVKFGSTAASSFTVDSDSQITATAPAATKVGRVDITATTLAGTSATTRADAFVYTGCVVPKLGGKTLRVAKNRLRGANCKLGVVRKVKRPAAKRGKVVKQNPKPGRVLAPGAKVNLKLGK
jgi:hypothetical protein